MGPHTADVQIVFVEMQPAIVASSRTQPEAALRRAASAVARIAGALDLPVLSSVVALDDRAPSPIEELAGFEAHRRTSIGLFGDTPSRERLARSGRQTLALAGVSSEIAVLRTALEGRAAGYDVQLLVDACGGLDARSEAGAFSQMQSAGVVMSNVSSFFTGLVDDVASKEGRVVMAALSELWSWGTAPA